MLRPPTATLAHLRHLCPDWCVGVAGRGILLRHLEAMTQSPLTPSLAGLAWNIASWRRQLLPWDLQTTKLHQFLGVHAGIHSARIWLPQQPVPSEDFARSMQSVVSGDTETLAHLWRKQPPKSIVNPTWIGEACLIALQHGARGLADMILENHGLEQSHPVILQLRALHAFCFEPAEAALARISLLPDDFSWLRAYLYAELMIRNGETEGITKLTALWHEIPWHANLTLKLHDLLHPPFPPQQPGSDTAVCIYSWNNAELLRDTLESLARSETGNASVLVLDNGSLDHTQEVVDASSTLFGERFQSMRLPVNIGAPAARNWLLGHDATARFENLVFLDDDVLLETNWLGELLARKAMFPNAVAVGCRIVNQTPSQGLQMADVNLLDFADKDEFLIANAAHGEIDLGLHSYARPCLSVTGCCHLLDRKRIMALGGFDLRYAPSQFDDFDLDLRAFLNGGHAVYSGQTTIRHCQRSSLSQADTEAKSGHIHGNQLKLNTKYSKVEKAEILRKNRELLWTDLLGKSEFLEQT